MDGAANTWLGFYLVCFLSGLGLSALSFLFGAIHAGGHDFGLHLSDLPGGDDAGHPGRSARINFGTTTAFLMWLGAAGFLLTRHTHLGPWLTLLLSVLAGLLGGGLVLLFVTQLLLGNERPMRSVDYEMAGVIGILTMPIRAGGTGEVVFSQAGTRRSAGARHPAGASLDRGTEVVVLRLQEGIAYVWPSSDPAPPVSDESP